jgi:hypothetical protein
MVFCYIFGFYKIIFILLLFLVTVFTKQLFWFIYSILIEARMHRHQLVMETSYPWKITRFNFQRTSSICTTVGNFDKPTQNFLLQYLSYWSAYIPHPEAPFPTSRSFFLCLTYSSTLKLDADSSIRLVEIYQAAKYLLIMNMLETCAKWYTGPEYWYHSNKAKT